MCRPKRCQRPKAPSPREASLKQLDPTSILAGKAREAPCRRNKDKLVSQISTQTQHRYWREMRRASCRFRWIARACFHGCRGRDNLMMPTSPTSRRCKNESSKGGVSTLFLRQEGHQEADNLQPQPREGLLHEDLEPPQRQTLRSLGAHVALELDGVLECALEHTFELAEHPVALGRHTLRILCELPQVGKTQEDPLAVVGPRRVLVEKLGHQVGRAALLFSPQILLRLLPRGLSIPRSLQLPEVCQLLQLRGRGVRVRRAVLGAFGDWVLAGPPGVGLVGQPAPDLQHGVLALALDLGCQPELDGELLHDHALQLRQLGIEGVRLARGEGLQQDSGVAPEVSKVRNGNGSAFLLVEREGQQAQVRSDEVHDLALVLRERGRERVLVA
mmetsp:Transcript_124550/g.398737  ORF Transcript_124550/g.398737 Transcript_124550/m.398737 type:complete len:388 (+) Transcript_124550:66-1229(+)